MVSRDKWTRSANWSGVSQLPFLLGLGPVWLLLICSSVFGDVTCSNQFSLYLQRIRPMGPSGPAVFHTVSRRIRRTVRSRGGLAWPGLLTLLSSVVCTAPWFWLRKYSGAGLSICS